MLLPTAKSLQSPTYAATPLTENPNAPLQPPIETRGMHGFGMGATEQQPKHNHIHIKIQTLSHS